jgi:hypothetical protein
MQCTEHIASFLSSSTHTHTFLFVRIAWKVNSSILSSRSFSLCTHVDVRLFFELVSRTLDIRIFRVAQPTKLTIYTSVTNSVFHSRWQ